MSTDVLSLKGLPADVEYEKWVLGSVLMNAADNLGLVADILQPADFSVPYHRVIFEHVLWMHAQDQPIDRATVSRSLYACGKHDDAGGIVYVNSMDEGLPVIYNLENYCETVQAKSMLRQAIYRAYTGITNLCAVGATLADLEAFKAEIAGLDDESKQRRGGFRHISEVIANKEGGGPSHFLNPPVNTTGVPWPWEGLNRMIGFLAPGQVVCLSAFTGVGKTTLMTQTALHAANLGNVAAIATLEMSATEQAKKIIAQHGKACLSDWLHGRSSKDDRQRVVAAARDMSSKPLYFDDREDVTPSMLRTAIERMKEKPAIVGVDYAQLMDSGIRDKGSSREQHVAHISRSLKKMAKKFDCALIVLSQLNEDGKTRESRALEQDATFHIKLERKAGGVYHLSCPKARFAASGHHIALWLDGETGLFTEAEEK